MEEKKEEDGGPIKFEVIGIVTSTPFQQCRLLVERLHRGLPKLYHKPTIRPMLNVEWEEYTAKIKRVIGGIIWTFSPLLVVVFKNGDFLGSEVELAAYVDKRHSIDICRNFREIGKEHLIEIFQHETSKGRQFVYLTVAIDDIVAGSLLFELYADLVPYTCYRFMEKCKRKKNGFNNTPIHRIVKDCWVQCGGLEMTHHRMPCENYTVPHDRRGVLSMCHAGKHKKNSVQFFITLAPASWMDTLYVAFGQLIQGAEVLRQIEQVPTHYESPTVPVEIISSGEFTLYQEYSEQDLKDLDKFLSKGLEERDNIRYLDIFDVDSCPDIRRYRRGLYSHHLDLQTYFPATVMAYLAPIPGPAGECDKECTCIVCRRDMMITFRADTDGANSTTTGDKTKRDYKPEGTLADLLDEASSTAPSTDAGDTETNLMGLGTTTSWSPGETATYLMGDSTAVIAEETDRPW